MRGQLAASVFRAWAEVVGEGSVHRLLVELQVGACFLEGDLAMFPKDRNARSFGANSSPFQEYVSWISTCTSTRTCVQGESLQHGFL